MSVGSDAAVFLFHPPSSLCTICLLFKKVHLNIFAPSLPLRIFVNPLTRVSGLRSRSEIQVTFNQEVKSKDSGSKMEHLITSRKTNLGYLRKFSYVSLDLKHPFHRPSTFLCTSIGTNA